MSHLTLMQRYTIEVLLKNGEKQSAIAQIIGCHKSTVCREINRNTGSRGLNAKVYIAQNAQLKTDTRNKIKHKRIRFNDQMKGFIKKSLTDQKWSPEIIAVKGRELFGEFVSLETIYQWIWKMKHSNKKIYRPYKFLFKDLKHSQRRQKRGNSHQNRGCIPDRISIEKRPKIVDRRKRFGDLEIDFIVGKDHKPGLLVITDRASLKTSLTKIKSKDASYIANKIVEKLNSIKMYLKTITYDNDLSFANHTFINKQLNTKSYFTRPYTAQDKGTIENRNGVIRRFFPKKTDFSLISHPTVKKVEKLLNSRPVRKFNYLSPDEYLLKNLKVAFIT